MPDTTMGTLTRATKTKLWVGGSVLAERIAAAIRKHAKETT